MVSSNKCTFYVTDLMNDEVTWKLLKKVNVKINPGKSGS